MATKLKNQKQKAGKKQLQKELLRRLRIQNKKLIEQIVRLKEEIKNLKKNKSK